MKQIIVGILLVVFLPFCLKGQDFSDFQMQKIRKNSKLVIKQYGKYANMIGDVNESDEMKFHFTKSFLKLFHNENVYVYNDLDPTQKSGREFPVKTYRNYITQWYSVMGLKTTIDESSVDYGDIVSENGNHYIKVRADKELSGVYMRTDPNQKTINLEFRITFDPNNLSVSTFRIVGIQKSLEKPAPAGQITGRARVTQGDIATFSVEPVEGAETYLWSLPEDVTGESLSNSITVQFGKHAKSGNIKVQAENKAGKGKSSDFFVEVDKLLPEKAGVIKGKTQVTQGDQGVLYVIPEIKHAESYTWTLPGGATGSSDKNFINLSFRDNARSGKITVCGVNHNGKGQASELAVEVKEPEAPVPGPAGEISGPAKVKPGQTASYKISPPEHAESYNWELPDGFVGESLKENIIIQFSKDAHSGTIRVKGVNESGAGPVSELFVEVAKPLPGAAGKINGKVQVMQGEKNIPYEVSEIQHAKTYHWLLPPGASGSSSSNRISLNFSSEAQSGKLSVHGVNDQGDGQTSSLFITVNKPLAENEEKSEEAPPVETKEKPKAEQESEETSMEPETTLKRSATIGTGKAVLLSTLVPGLGQTKLSRGKPYWIFGVLAYGSLGASYYFNTQSVNTYEDYKEAGDTGTREDLFSQSETNKSMSQNLAIAAGALWGVNLVWAIIQGSKANKTAHNNLSWHAGYNQNAKAPVLTLQLRY